MFTDRHSKPWSLDAEMLSAVPREEAWGHHSHCSECALPDSLQNK